MAATPIGSLLVTLGVSQTKDVGWWWNSQSELEVAAAFASVGILFYTASFAALETGVMSMVLAYHVIKKFEEDREKRRKEQFDKGIALALEADRRRQGTEDSLEQAIAKLQEEGWQPLES